MTRRALHQATQQKRAGLVTEVQATPMRAVTSATSGGKHYAIRPQTQNNVHMCRQRPYSRTGSTLSCITQNGRVPPVQRWTGAGSRPDGHFHRCGSTPCHQDDREARRLQRAVQYNNADRLVNVVPCSLRPVNKKGECAQVCGVSVEEGRYGLRSRASHDSPMYGERTPDVAVFASY
ncbi:hypothetical protein HPB50_027201 [Hyalomma asiaticum]|uniref:Uncharacterized protein n=1 Tax=Hyalomma asiaticum TaxID=266040 RepID=A0ACB7TQ59_HYAAI|nr:hypothetical protein HPB50_027201 [Hyalomma asiaticum]